MGASPEVFAAALSEANAHVRRYPKLVHLLDLGEATDLVAAYVARRAVRAWLYHLPVTKHDDAIRDILTDAHSHVWEGGEADRVHALYSHHLASGRLIGLSPTVVAVHRAVFTLAVWQGTPVLAATRFLATAICQQSGIERDARTLSRALERLHRLDVIEWERGERGLKSTSGRIRLPLSDTPPGTVPSVTDVLDLAMTTDLELALSDYRHKARGNLRQRSDAAHTRHAGDHLASVEAQARESAYYEPWGNAEIAAGLDL